MNVRLFGTFSLRSPLSHIGESISTISYLVQEPVLQDDGSLEDVFCYSGNSWRGQLRDQAATYMLERLGNLQVPLEQFHLLFSGGRIGGEQVIDIERARLYRRAVPMFALWGGGVGNQILPGKLRVANSYPVCLEALPVLPGVWHEAARRTSYKALTFEKSFSRKDDTKDDRLRGHIAPLPGQQTLLADTVPARKAKDGDDGAPADQMRMTVELVAAGTKLVTEIDALDVSEVELGCLVSALHRFSLSPYIGGQGNKGHGRVELRYQILDLDTGKIRPFLEITDGPALLAPPAAQAKEQYDAHLRLAYDAMLASQKTEMVALLGGRGGGR